jgi:hypothetical protein
MTHVKKLKVSNLPSPETKLSLSGNFDSMLFPVGLGLSRSLSYDNDSKESA